MTYLMDYHSPVLLKETVDGLAIKPDGVYVDVTFGGGGHSREILKRLGADGKLFAFDQDKDALENAIDDPRFTLGTGLCKLFVFTTFSQLNVAKFKRNKKGEEKHTSCH